MENKQAFLQLPLIKIFVYGTLRKEQRLGFYLNQANFLGEYYTEGQLIKGINGNVFIDFSYKNVITVGEVYHVNYYCLQRINHLEVFSGVFPLGYDLNVIPIWKMNDEKQYCFDKSKSEKSFFYKQRNSPIKILTGDYSDDFQPIEELEQLLLNSGGLLQPDSIVEEMQKRLSIFESL